MPDIWEWSATDIASKVAAGDISAREVAEAVLTRIKAVEPKLNALSEVTEDIALEAADEVDRAFARGDALGPLAGVPVTTKNNVDQAGTLNTGGVAAAKGNLCGDDSPLVANLKQAGAVVVGRTNVPAFSFRWFTDTDLHGRTYNPHGRHLSPGGSSGGAGAAVAAGMGPLAHGNDIGGSIRFPAYANGIAGLRPTVGRVPSGNPSNGGMRVLTSQLFTADGPMARCVADLELGVNVMAGRDSRDPQQVPMPPVRTASLPARIGLARSSGLGTPAPEVDDALSRAAEALESAGCAVEDVVLPRFEEAHDIWQKLVFHTIWHHFGDAIRNSGDRALVHNIETVRDFVPDISGGEALDLWVTRLQIMREWSLMFDTFPVVMMPVSYRHGLMIDADQGDGASLQALFNDQSPLLATAILGHPGLSVPTGLAEDGAPTGIQLGARWWDEGTLLAVGQVIENAMPQVRPVTPE